MCLHPLQGRDLSAHRGHWESVLAAPIASALGSLSGLQSPQRSSLVGVRVPVHRGVTPEEQASSTWCVPRGLCVIVLLNQSDLRAHALSSHSGRTHPLRFSVPAELRAGGLCQVFGEGGLSGPFPLRVEARSPGTVALLVPLSESPSSRSSSTT